MASSATQPPAPTADFAPPIPFTLTPLIIPSGKPTSATSHAKTAAAAYVQTKVALNGYLKVAFARGDVFVLGLAEAGSKTKEKTDGAGGCGGGCACAHSDAKGEEKDVKDFEGGKKKEVNQDTDLAPLGGAYELVLEPIAAETHDLVRILGIVYRKSGDDKACGILLQLLPYPISLCKLYLHSRPTNANAGSTHGGLFGRLESIFTPAKDENGLKLDEQGWGRVPEGCALNVSPSVNNVADGGTDVKLEITFNNFHPHGVSHAFKAAHGIFNGDHSWFSTAPGSGEAEEKEQEVVSIGGHIVTGA